MSVAPFSPEPFSTPVIAPQATTLSRRIPYLAPSEYKAAPTAVATAGLVPGGSVSSNAAELYAALLRASDWADLLCFHGPDGTLAASPTVEAGWVTPKARGDMWLQCAMRPILEVIGIAMGSSPGQLTSMDSSQAGNVSIDGNLIMLTNSSGGIQPFSPTRLVAPAGRSGRTYAAWSYVAGFPHCILAANAAEGAETITVQSAVPGGATPYGVYPGTQLTIRDTATGSGYEDVVVSAVNGSVLTLATPLQFAHTIPAYPDYIPVSAMPHGVQQAVISLASCLIKTRGTKSMVMPSTPGGVPTKAAMGQAGGLDDFDIAQQLLKSFTTVYRRSVT